MFSESKMGHYKGNSGESSILSPYGKKVGLNCSERIQLDMGANDGLCGAFD